MEESKENLEKDETEIKEEVGKVEEKSESKTEKKKGFRINGVSIWRIFVYFAIYSFLGFFVESAYGVLTKGQLESRQSFLYGPFCGIYGVGAVIMIVALQRVKSEKKWKMFLGGFIVGSVTEYVVSLLGELLFNVKWWDYSDMFLNVGGRICLFFSLMWGFLAIFLIGKINPQIDRFIEFMKRKFSYGKLKFVTAIITLFLFLDFCVTAFALVCFNVRMVVEHDINISNRASVEETYHKIYDNEALSEIIYKFFNDKKMIRTFPNLKIEDQDGNIIYFDYLLPDIQPYYFKVNLGI